MTIYTLIAFTIGIPSALVFIIAARNWLIITRSDRLQKRNQKRIDRKYKDYMSVSKKRNRHFDKLKNH
jgi:hypothetical protein